MDSSDDEPTSIFANRANKIMQSTLEAYEKFKTEEKFEEKEEVDEYDELVDKIKNKLKRKPAAKRGKKGKKAKVDLDVSAEEFEEVTPPKATRRTTRRTKQRLEEGLKEESSKTKAPTPINLPALAKRRLKELKLRTDREAAQVEEEVRRTLSSCDKDVSDASEITSLLELERTITLKIRYMSDISKIDVQENEKFTNIFTKVADLYKLKASEILLCLEDKNIQLEDTPLSLKLKFFDIIDCIPFKTSQLAVKENDPNSLLIKFQSSDSRKKIEMHIHKLEKFQVFMEKYSELRGIPLKSLTFEFDGETIEGTETPEDLDMESGSCIDVKVAKAPEKESNKDQSIIEDYIAPIPKSQMLNICVLD